MFRTVLMAVTFAVAGNQSHAASFDCKKASSFAETTVCSDNDIGSMDERLSQIYRDGLPANPDLRDSQREWLKSRNACETAKCVRDAYESRLAQLTTQTTETAAPADAPSSAAVQISPRAQPSISPPPPPPPTQHDTVPPPNNTPVAVTNAPAGEGQISDSALQIVRNVVQTLRVLPTEQLIALGATATVILAIPLYGFLKRCPRCGQWFAAKKIGREMLGQSTGFKTVTRRDEVKDKLGQLQKTIEREEQVQVVTSTYRDYLRCKHCGNEWTTLSSSESS
jgi:uncharacterized protein YecT (DUF1311 family)